MQPIKIVNEDNPLDTSAPVVQDSYLQTSNGLSLKSINDTPRNNTILFIAIAIAVVVIVGLIAVIIKSHKAKKTPVFIKPDKKAAAVKAE